MAEWYVQQPNPETEEDFVGPLRPGDLLKLVREGEVGPDDMIRKDNSAWFEAREVGGLFEAALRPTICYYCPQCDTQVTEPPVKCLKCGRDIRKAREEITENAIVRKEDQSLATQAGRSVQKWLQKRSRRKERDKDDE